MDRGHRGRGPLVACLVLIVGACAAGTPTTTQNPTMAAVTPAPPASALAIVTQTSTPAPASSAAPVPTPTAEPAPNAIPTPSSTPKPAQAPAVAPGWTTPVRLGKTEDCGTISAGIDAASRYHVAAACGGSVRYFVSNDGRAWSSTRFAHPAHRMELEPQIAFRGDVVYVAYSRIAPDEGCGSNGAEVGVYFRTRVQPGGAWSNPVRIGAVADRLEAFQVDGGTIHATVRNDRDSGVYYETLAGPTYHRYRIPKAVGGTSLRIGTDGRARIAYESAHGLGYAVFTGSGLSTSRITGTTERDWAPLLVLNASNKPAIVWNRSERPGGGCAMGGPEPQDGMYYATSTGGTWTPRRISKEPGDASVQLDAATGRVFLLVSGRYGLSYYTKAPGGAWTRTRVLRQRWSMSPLLRLDPATGNLLAVYMGQSSSWSTGIYALIKH